MSEFDKKTPEEQQAIIEASTEDSSSGSIFSIFGASPATQRIKKDAVDRSKLSRRRKRYLEKTEGTTAAGRGLYGEESIEPDPPRTQTSSETVRKKGGAYHVMGRDRPGSRKSGYGGKGDTQCASIDLYVGPQGADVAEEDPTTGESIMVDPDFTKDAARIYMSQKTDIDDNFGLCHGSVGCPPAKSAVGIKADGVRMIGREGIKLVTATDARNSQGVLVDVPAGIDLIAGNDDRDLQPLVKGSNLSFALAELSDVVNSLNGILTGFLNEQMEFNQHVMLHTHNSPFFGLPTLQSITLGPPAMKTFSRNLMVHLRDCAANKATLKNWIFNYCNPAGKKYFCSRSNKTN